MSVSLLQFEQNCDLLTTAPDRRTGPISLGAAVRCVVEHRPLAKIVEIVLPNGHVIDETVIIALYEAGRLEMAVSAGRAAGLGSTLSLVERRPRAVRLSGPFGLADDARENDAVDQNP